MRSEIASAGVAWALVFALTNVSCTTAAKRSGTIDEDYRQAIKMTVGGHGRELRQCYYLAIDEKPMSEGRLTVSWVIAPDGRVKDTKLVSAEPKIAHVYPCIKARLEDWVFPKTPNGEEVEVGSYPLVFSENGRIGSPSGQPAPGPSPSPSPSQSPSEALPDGTPPPIPEENLESW